jgi:predicted AlkP superfamily pyrophosphatase or phosphodiesterase
MKFFRFLPLLLLPLLLTTSAARVSGAIIPRAKGRIFILMVWDGLRPDLVTERDTPNLFALEHAGTSFAHHHAVFPSVTMVNAAALATGYPPGGTGIFGDEFYLPPALAALSVGPPRVGIAKPVDIESTIKLVALNQPGLLHGSVLDAVSIGQRVRRAHGYLAVAGKSGPTFLFDSPQFTDFTDLGDEQCALMADDVLCSPTLVRLIGPLPTKFVGGVPFAARDAWYTDAVIAESLPAAIAASNRGRAALIVLWQRNPDFVQHRAGLGTEVALEALTRDDQNLGRLRASIAAQRVADRTDLMVVSDHGFVTLGSAIHVSELLVGAGLKNSKNSDDVIAIDEQGSEQIYLSRSAFPSAAERKARLQKIVDFAATQDWCGPIFSRAPASWPRRNSVPDAGGWIAGTFDERALGLYDPRRSPDLIISMRENAEQSNRALTGPDNPAFFIGPNGRQPVRNRSQTLVRPEMGTLGGAASEALTTGMGGHGAVGRRELHNFCAVVGPDFHRRWVDRYPTGNTDVAPTIAYVLGLPREQAGVVRVAKGRIMAEALSHGRHRYAISVAVTMTARLDLPRSEIDTELRFTQIGDHRYLDDARVDHRRLRARRSVRASFVPSR